MSILQKSNFFDKNQILDQKPAHLNQKFAQNYVENGSDEKVRINQTDGQYSFTMPASDVTISVESQTLTRITDYTIATTLITGYTGSETEVVMPSSYYPYQQETRNTLRFENMG